MGVSQATLQAWRRWPDRAPSAARWLRRRSVFKRRARRGSLSLRLRRSIVPFGQLNRRQVGVSRLSALLCAVLASLATFLASTDASSAEKRVALVVANAQYRDASLALYNPRNDGADVADTLRELGFEVVLSTDVNKRQFDLSLQTFSRIATGADSALFFYAGHAMQFQGRNYLVPVDAELEDEISVRYQAVALDDISAALSRAAGVKIMILDACRNNPLANRVNRSAFGGTRSGEAVRGLARIDKSEGMVVAYATAADNVALDGTGRNSPFTTALLNRMREPGLEIEMMFRRVTADVNAATNGRQRPETYISLLTEYYLNQNDRVAWDRIKDQNDPAALREFVRRFPTSIRAIDARRRLELLEQYAEERRREEQNKAAETQRLAAERESTRRREEAERQKAARETEEAERARRLAEERKREEEKKAAELQMLTAVREAARRREEAERHKAARETEEAEKARRLAEERRAEQEAVTRRLEAEKLKAAKEAREEQERLAEAARRLADAEMARVEREAREAEAREQTRLAAIKSSASAPAPATPRPADDQPYQIAAVAPVETPAGPGGHVKSADPILDVQLELARLGCFAGDASGEVDAATKAALQNYLKNSGQRGPLGALDADFVAHLRLHERRVCPLQCAPGTVARADSCVAAPAKPAPSTAKQSAPPPRRTAAPVRRAREAAPVAQAAPAARPPAAAPSSNRSVTGVGF